MNTVSISITVPPALTQTLSTLSDSIALRSQFADAAGRACANLTRDHLFTLAGARHRAAVPHNFYADAADSVTHDFSFSESIATVRIRKTGLAQRLYGGTIKPVNYSHLWIPVSPESIGRTGREFQNLIKIINRQTDRGVAARREADKTLTVLFALVPEVIQEADPSVLPTDREFQETATEACNTLLDLIKQGAA
jgi:hypothetical protein